MTIHRAWCSACSEWCYPHALCVRGEALVYQRALEAIVQHGEAQPVPLDAVAFNMLILARTALA